MRATGRYSATGLCPQASRAMHAWRSSTVPNTRSSSSRGADMAVDDRFAEDFRETRDDEYIGTRSEVITGPVADWATDFSHVEPEWSADPYPIQDDLRQRCPIAHTGRFGGAWLPTRYEDVAAIAYDTERFSSRSIIMSNFRPPRDLAPVGTAPPISSDPPFHHDARKLLLPAFTKAVVTRQEPATRAFCDSLIDGFEGRDVVDAAADYAQHIPIRVIADMLGFPPEDGPQFREFVEDLLEGINVPPDERIERVSRLFDYLLAQVHDHLDRPRDDLTTYLINAELYGQKLAPDVVTGAMALLLIAGIDTTWSAIGASLWHLAKTPGNRHAAFGLGIHRCVGSHLARMELRVALEAWLSRIPRFTLDDPSAVTWSAGQIRGPRTLPLRIR